MAGLTEQIYGASPLWAQEMALSFQGLRLRRQRRGGGFSTALREALDRWAWSRDQLEAFQLQRLRAFLVHAENTSEYYRVQFRRWGTDPTALRYLDQFSSFPVLEKETLRSATRQIRSQAYSDRQTPVHVHTSGTTGTPIAVAFTIADVRARYAALHRMLVLAGIEPGARSVRFSGRTFFPGVDDGAPPWRHNWSDDQLFMSTYHLRADRLANYADKLAAFRPVLIDGYPSAIHILARHIIQSGRAGEVSPRAIATTAETLSEEQRADISEAFGGCPVLNQYASSEGAPFITTDLSGDLVVNVDTGVFEFVKPGTTTPADRDEPSELLVTSFSTHAYPLIRYRIGDTAVTGGLRTATTTAMPTIKALTGRQDDLVWSPHRGLVGRLDPVFKTCPSSIREAQIEQVEAAQFVLRIVPDQKTYQSDHLQPILQQMRERLGPVGIDIQVVSSIPRSANGKFRAVIGLPEGAKATGAARQDA